MTCSGLAERAESMGFSTVFASDHLYVGAGDGLAVGWCGPNATTFLVEDLDGNLAKVTWGRRRFSIFGVFPGAGFYGRGTRVAPDGTVRWTEVWVGVEGAASTDLLLDPDVPLAPGAHRSTAGPDDVLPAVTVHGDLVAAAAPFRTALAGAPPLAWTRVNSMYATVSAESVEIGPDGCFASREAEDPTGATPRAPERICRDAVRIATFEGSLGPLGLAAQNFPSPDEDPVAAGWPDAGFWAFMPCGVLAALPPDAPGRPLMLDACARPQPRSVCPAPSPCADCACVYYDCVLTCNANCSFCEQIYGACAYQNCLDADCELDPNAPSCDPPCSCTVCPMDDDCVPPKGGPGDAACKADPEAPYCSWYQAKTPPGGQP